MDGIDGCSVDGFNEWIHWIDDRFNRWMDAFNGRIQWRDSSDGFTGGGTQWVDSGGSGGTLND